MAANDRILLIGAGNLATSLGVTLALAGRNPVAVWSRSIESAQQLASRIGCDACCDIDALPSADIVIITVVDSALPVMARAVADKFPDALILHTAGSVPMNVLRDAGARRYGVFYPMQTFTRRRIADFAKITLFVEACDDENLSRIESLASVLTDKVVRATSEQRRFLHIAAVFACNFSNAAYCMAADLLAKNNLPFEAMLPLIDETAAKVHTMSPYDAQTGPARRGDVPVLKNHENMLDGRLKELYTAISDYIADNNIKNSKI